LPKLKLLRPISINVWRASNTFFHHSNPRYNVDAFVSHWFSPWLVDCLRMAPLPARVNKKMYKKTIDAAYIMWLDNMVFYLKGVTNG